MMSDALKESISQFALDKDEESSEEENNDAAQDKRIAELES